MTRAAASALYVFGPDERPLFPGGPFAPRHSKARKAGYVAAALVSGIAATLGNALVNVNAAVIAGDAGLYAEEAAWLPAVFIGLNATANLLVIKARVQFGIQPVTQTLVAAYALAALLQLIVPGFPAMIAVRAAGGIAAAALTTIVIFDLVQVFPPKARPLALAIAINITQLGTPLARLFPVELLALGAWQGLALTELALALAALVMLNIVPLPPGERARAFEPLDFVTAALAVPAFLLVAGVLAQGRLHWWLDAPWLGWMIAAAVPLLAAVFLIERSRANPLLVIDWLTSRLILRFALVALLVRLALAEQSFGSVGLLAASGLTNDQLRTLFLLVALAMVLGTLTMVLSFRPHRLRYQVLAATLVIALGAWLDSHSSNLTRPEQLYLSQALIGFGTCLFLGPALLHGFLQVLQRGPNLLVSFVVLLSTTQNMGGLAGSALLGSYQTVRARHHAESLAGQLSVTNVQLPARLQAGSGAVARVITDPEKRSREGANLLRQSLTREANILAFNDTFRLVTLLALLPAGLLAFLVIFKPQRAAPAGRRHP